MTADPRPSHSHYAGLVSRLGSLTVDVVVVALAAAGVRHLPTLLWESVIALPTPHWLSEIAGAAAVIVPWLYFTISWWLANRTVGNLLVGVCVLRDDGEELSFPHAAVRAVVGLVLAPLWIIGLASVLWDDRRRAWHDRLLGTVVRYAPTSSASH